MALADQADSPVVFTDGAAVRCLLSGSQEEFPRPATGINRIVTAIMGRFRCQELNGEEIRGWLADSLDVFSHFVEEPAVLDRISRETAWVISNEEPPDPDVWSGECKFADGGTPVVICYRGTMASRLPGHAFHLAWQGSMDHFVGHLYPYFRGAEEASEYDEDVACRYQHLAAQQRGRRNWRFRMVARLLPWVYRLHKRIPLSNYAPLSA